MRLVEEIPAPSPAAAEAVAALRAAREASASTEDPDGWAPPGASTDWDEPRGLTNTEAAQMEELRNKYGKYQRERDGGDAVHVSVPDAALARARALVRPPLARARRVDER